MGWKWRPGNRARSAGVIAAALLLGVLALAGLTNRRVAPTGAVSFPGRPLGAGDFVEWEFDAETPLSPELVVLSGAWAVRGEVPATGTLLAAATASATRGQLCQTAGGPTGWRPLDFLLVDKRFPLLALGDTVYEDVRVEARFKLLRGTVDRAAGFAFRMRNQDEYYVVRASSLEGNVNLYRFVDGRRSLIAEVPATVESNVWHTLSVEARGSHIAWALDDQPLGAVDDLTFRRGGGLGLWTRADSVACFIQIRAIAL